MNDGAYPKSVWRVRVSYQGVNIPFLFAGYDPPSVGRILKAVATARHKAVLPPDCDDITIHSVGAVRGVVFVE